MAVTLGPKCLQAFERFSLYNSPYPAHDEGCAIDLYPGTGRGTEAVAPSPVAGVVRETKTVRAPPKPYAPERDHLIVIDVDAPPGAAGAVARILHVDPGVGPGDRVAVGESLGTLVRAGFFAPWVADHVHLGFRRPAQDPVRASGSLPIAVDVDPVALPWDGTGTVVECGETFAVLDAPTASATADGTTASAATGDASASKGSASAWYGVATDDGGVLDGGFPHYDGGGCLRAANAGGRSRFRVRDGGARARNRTVRLFGERLGRVNGRTVDWDSVRLLANGDPITGLSFSVARGGAGGAKLVWRDPRTERFPPGTAVRVGFDRR